jgi:hypothetical protein
MIKAITFEPWHLECVRNNVKENFLDDPDVFERLFTIAKNPTTFIHTIVWSVDEEIKVIGVVGGNLIWRGVMDVFTILTKLVKKFAISFTKELKKILDFYERSLCISRFQATVRDGQGNSGEWLKTLGFGQEARLQKFGPQGDDYLLFARIVV